MLETHGFTGEPGRDCRNNYSCQINNLRYGQQIVSYFMQAGDDFIALFFARFF
jgi:hypothetical protein